MQTCLGTYALQIVETTDYVNVHAWAQEKHRCFTTVHAKAQLLAVGRQNAAENATSKAMLIMQQSQCLLTRSKDLGQIVACKCDPRVCPTQQASYLEPSAKGH